MFAAEGLDVAPVFIRGGPVVIAALLSGDADYAVMAGTTAVASISRGAEVMIVGGHTGQIDQVLLGATSIAKVGDLKGKVVGVTGSGGITEFATVEALARSGLARDRDYKVLYAGPSPMRLKALEAGVIHAAPFSAIERAAMESKGLPVILEIGKIIPEFPFAVIVTNKQKVKSNPAEIVALLKAIRAAMNFIKTDKEKVIASAAKKDPTADVNVLQKSLNYSVDSFSISITKKNIAALTYAVKLSAPSEKVSPAENLYTEHFVGMALGAQ